MSAESTPLEIEEIKRRLRAALVVRAPLFDPSARVAPRERIEGLEQHILHVAWHVGQLEEALYWLIEIGKNLRAEWDGIEGHHAQLPSRPTQEQVKEAKRRIKPDVYAALEEARTLTDSIKRQVHRLGGSDYDAASRAYTMLSGS